MATTVLTNQSNRLFSDNFLRAASITVPADAVISEDFTLPVGFGSLHIKTLIVAVSDFSGTYAAPTPPFDGVEVVIVSSDGTTRVDNLGTGRFVLSATVSARPQFTVGFDLQNHVLQRLGERIRVQAPIIAGAGITVTVSVQVRGTRFQTA